MQEDVCFLILKNPFQNISTSLNQPFNLAMKISYNFTYWPRVDDVILRGLTESVIPEGSQRISFNEVRAEDRAVFYSGSSGASLMKLNLAEQPKPLIKTDEVYFLDRIEMWSKLLNKSSDSDVYN